MIKKYLKYFKFYNVDVFIYYHDKDTLTKFETPGYQIEKRIINNKKSCYYIQENGTIIHESYVYKKTYILGLIQKKGPTIGDCNTIASHRGKSIYPFVINYIAHQEIHSNNTKEVFIIVNTDNHSSIKGIEKAGFKKHSRITAKKFLLFYFR